MFRPSLASHEAVTERVRRYLGPDAPTMRRPTRWEHFVYRVSGRYPWSYIEARCDWSDALKDYRRA